MDAAEAEALGTLGEAGLLGPGGDPSIDAAKLLPQVATASSGPLFYRVCSESATKPTSCSGPRLLLPLLGLPARVDVTGDGTADVSAQLRRTLTGALDFVVRRLATSETTGTSLPAHVWATHDLSATRRLSLGFDGFRRGTTLPQVTSGRFTVARTLAGQGVFDVAGALSQSGAGTAFAVTTGLASLVSGTTAPFDPIVASARFSPVPTQFSTHGRVDVTAGRSTLDATANRATALDSIVVANRRTGGAQLDRFSRLTSPLLAGRVAADLTRSSVGSVTLRGEAPGVDALAFTDYSYDGSVLDRAIQASGLGVPSSFSLAQTGGTGVTLGYAASGPMAGLDAGTYDRGTDTVTELSATDLPTSLDLGVDPAADHVSVDASQPVGAGSVALSGGHGSFAPLAEDHVTLVRAGEAYGVSARLTGLRSADALFGSHPRLTTATETGVGPFVAAGQSGVERSRLEVSNLPAELSLDLDPVARTLAHRGSGAVPLVEADYAGTAAGPTVSVAMSEAPSSVEVGYDAGQRPRVASSASGPIPRLELFASDDHITVLQPEMHHYLSLAASHLPDTAEIALDLVGSHLEATQSAALGGLDLVGRAPVGGRSVTAAVDLAGAPSQFDADFGAGQLRMRGLSGPIGSARLAVTNHAGTEIPVGEHLAVRHRQLTGAVDASLSLSDLTHAEYSHISSSQQFRLDAGPSGPAWLDADVRLADGGVDDTQLMVAARIDTLPHTLRVRLVGDELEYVSSAPSGLLAEVRIGKVAALSGLGAPLFDNGAAIRARGCAPGPGCATDSTPVCTSLPRCLGVVGTIQLSSMPTEVRFDLASHGVALTGYAGPSTLQLYNSGEDFAPLPVAVLAILTGVPSPLDVELTSVDVSKGTIRVDYTASAPIDSLTVLAESEETSGRLVRAKASVSPVAASVQATGRFGSATDIRYVASAPADEVGFQATGEVVGGVASGLAQLTNVPSDTRLVAGAYRDASVLGVPSLDYTANGSTLDGVVHVERAFAGEVGAFPDAAELFLRFTDLGASTRIATAPDQSVNFFSVPATSFLAAGAALESSLASLPVDLQVFDEAGFTGTLSGHIGAPTIHMGDLGLSVTGLRSLSLLPGEMAYLSIGVVGNYDVLTLDPSDMFIDPDVEMTLDVDGPGPLNDQIHFSTQDPFTGVRFHLSDQVMRESGCVASEVFGVGTFHVRVFSKPGKIATQVNHIDVFGVDGPQVINYLDPIPTPLGQDPALVSLGIDLFTAYLTQPLPSPEVDYEPDFGGC